MIIYFLKIINTFVKCLIFFLSSCTVHPAHQEVACPKSLDEVIQSIQKNSKGADYEKVHSQKSFEVYVINLPDENITDDGVMIIKGHE